MKFKKTYILLLSLIALFGACKKEDKPIAAEDLHIPELFSPPADADPKVKAMYNDYGLWLRMDYKNWAEVTNGILGNDPIAVRFGGTKIDDSERQNAITYTQSLLSNVSVKYSKSFFPLEFFYVKTYGRAFYKYDLMIIGRSRLVIAWPNEMYGALPVTDPENHYYRDSVLTRAIWGQVGTMITARMEKPIEGFELAGKAYNSDAYNKIMSEFWSDHDPDKRDVALEELARTGGFISGSASTSFESDFTSWLTLLTTESFANIQAQYLNNNVKRTNKYNILIKFFNSYGWDIQAAGNKYRAKLDAFAQE